MRAPARSAANCSASRMKGELHPIIPRSTYEADFRILCVLSCISNDSLEGGGGRGITGRTPSATVLVFISVAANTTTLPERFCYSREETTGTIQREIMLADRVKYPNYAFPLETGEQGERTLHRANKYSLYATKRNDHDFPVTQSLLTQPMPRRKVRQHNAQDTKKHRQSRHGRGARLFFLTRATIEVVSRFRLKCFLNDLRHSLTQNRRKKRHFILHYSRCIPSPWGGFHPVIAVLFSPNQFLGEVVSSESVEPRNKNGAPLSARFFLT